MDTPDRHRDTGSDGNGNGDLSSEDVYRTMDPLEPYTTGELATVLDAPKRITRRLLNALAGEEKIRKKTAEPERTIWIREPPKHECSACGGTFEIKYSHPVFQAVQYCPKCGTRLERSE